jgi:mono/diheme cytochrome c family protein
MKNLKTLFIVASAAALGFAACSSDEHRKNPGRAYAMDMTHSRAYDAYTANPNFTDSQTSRMPVPGTVARGHSLPDHMLEGDTNGYKTFTTAAKFNDAEIKEGGRLFNIYCAICHGPAMDGNGPLYASGKFAAMPANLVSGDKLKMPVGQIYAAIKYGKNAMGSYASQLDPVQRWQIIAYIKKQQAGAGGDAFTMGLTGGNAAAADTAKKAGDASASGTAHAGTTGEDHGAHH